MSNTFPEKIDKSFDVSFPSTFCFVSSFFGRFSEMKIQKLRKTIYKKIARKSFYKRIDKNPKTGVFSVRGVQKHHTKYQKNRIWPQSFLASDLPTDPRGSPICAFLLAPS
jgi:hypothetical protein